MGGAAPAANGAAGGQPDYSAQWAQYYRSIGKHDEAKAIEAQMKKVNSYLPSTQYRYTYLFKGANGAQQPVTGGSASVPGGLPPQQPGNAYQQQQPYGGYQANQGMFTNNFRKQCYDTL